MPVRMPGVQGYESMHVHMPGVQGYICVRGRPRLDAVVVRVGDEGLALKGGDVHGPGELLRVLAAPDRSRMHAREIISNT